MPDQNDVAPCAHINLIPKSTGITVNKDADRQTFSRDVTIDTYQCEGCGLVVDAGVAYMMLARRVVRLEGAMASGGTAERFYAEPKGRQRIVVDEPTNAERGEADPEDKT